MKDQIQQFIQDKMNMMVNKEHHQQALNQLNLKDMDQAKLYGRYVDNAKKEPALRKQAKRIRRGRV